MAVPKNNLSYPVLISGGEGGRGSGFYLNTENGTYLVTACHVLFRRRLELFQGLTTLTSLASDFSSKVVFELDCAKLLADGSLRKHDRADVAVCKLGTVADAGGGKRTMTAHSSVKVKVAPPAGAEILGLPVSITRNFDDATISNDVYLFGYPTSLGHNAQLDKAMPLLRKGIIAGKTDDSRLIVDCPVYFGNSGGLVVESFMGALGATYFYGVGIAVEMIPFVEELWSRQFNTQTGVRYENSGYSIVEPMDRILELL